MQPIGTVGKYIAYKNNDGFIELYKSRNKNKAQSTKQVIVASGIERIVTNVTTVPEAETFLRNFKRRMRGLPPLDGDVPVVDVKNQTRIE